MASLGFAAAVLCAVIMGFAIQRGTTCTVLAVNEVIEQGTVRRLAAMIEAALWVTGGLLMAKALHLLAQMPSGFPLTGWTVAGGVLLGLGAVINGACIFGALARLGSGEWAYAATPAGFYLGCLSYPLVAGVAPLQPLPDPSPVLSAPGWTVLPFLGFAAWRILRPVFALRTGSAGSGAAGHRAREPSSLAWSPHAATTVIGITFVISLLLAGAWAYTEALADLARDMAGSLTWRMLLLGALLAGAVLGGWTAGRLRRARPPPSQILRCALGGAAMAWGALLVPGSNDGLVLLGMPLLWPYAWVAFAVMCAAIAAARLLRPRGLPGKAPARGPTRDASNQ